MPVFGDSASFLPLPSLLQALGAAAFLYCLYAIQWELTVGASRRALIKQNGCKPIREFSEFNSFPNNIVGLKTVRENISAYREHRVLECIQGRYARSQSTLHYKSLRIDTFHTIEPENLKAIMATKFKDFYLPDRRKHAFMPLLGAGIFTTDGHAWQNSRDLIRPNFVRSQVGDLDTFEIHVAQLIKRIPKDGSTVDLQDLFCQLTMDSATEFLFGESTDTLSGKDDFSARFAQAFNRSQEEIANGIRSGLISKFFRTKEFAEDCKFVHDFVDQFVQKGLAYRKALDASDKKEGRSRYVFLHELVKATSDPIQIRSELLNVLLAGRDTTASLLSNVFFLLARRPDVWAKLRKEIDSLEGGKPTYEQIKEMKYLRAVMNESKPPSAIFGRLEGASMSLTDVWHSSTSVSSGTRQCAHGHHRHRYSSWRRLQWELSSLCPQRQNNPVVNLRDASTKGLLWQGRRGVQTRAVGDAKTWVGILTLQRWAENLHWPAIRPYRGQLYHYQTDAGIQGY